MKKETLEKLDLYVPVVDRVHGAHHPEFHTVKALYEELNEKYESGQSLTEVFNNLREVTDNYQVPNDVCESYEAVYHMLQELDQEYSK